MNTRRPRGPAADTRDRLLAGTLECLRVSGVSGTTIAAVSRASGLSRPTIYAHFNTLDDLIHQAVEDAAVELSVRIARELTGAMSPADRIVEFVVAAHREFRTDPVVALVIDMSLAPSLAAHGTISPAMFRLTRERLASVFPQGGPELDRLDDIIETMIRFLLSVLMFTSDNTADDTRLRAYLRRTLVPALSLSSAS